MPDTAVPDLMLEAFRRNARVNAALLSALTPDDYALSDGRGGWTVARHLSHIAAFRGGWLLNISPAHAEPLTGMTGARRCGSGNPATRRPSRRCSRRATRRPCRPCRAP